MYSTGVLCVVQVGYGLGGDCSCVWLRGTDNPLSSPYGPL